MWGGSALLAVTPPAHCAPSPLLRTRGVAQGQPRGPGGGWGLEPETDRAQVRVPRMPMSSPNTDHQPVTLPPGSINVLARGFSLTKPIQILILLNTFPFVLKCGH